MQQRVPRNWLLAGGRGHRRRLLVESADAALAVSEFRMFADAGFIVAHCEGPTGSPWDCPLLRGGDCPLVAGADVILHVLEPVCGVLDAIKSRHPKKPVVALTWGRGVGTGTPADVEIMTRRAPVESQIRALRRVVLLAEVQARRDRASGWVPPFDGAVFNGRTE